MIVLGLGTITFCSTELRSSSSIMTSITMRRQLIIGRHSATLREKSLYVAFEAYEEYVDINMKGIYIHKKRNSVSRDALNPLMPGISGTMLS